MTKEVLKLALEALHGFIPYLPLNDEAQCGRYDEAITAIKEALAQEQEPVAYGMWDTMIGCGGCMMYVRLDKGQDGCTVPLYTTPPQRTWVDLTHEQFAEILCDDRWRCRPELMLLQVQAKLKDKNL